MQLSITLCVEKLLEKQDTDGERLPSGAEKHGIRCQWGKGVVA
jgi:hypothetical protein